MENLITITSLLTASWFHFVFSGLVGLTVFSLIQIITYAVCPTFYGRASFTTGQRYFMVGLALVSAFSAAWLAHIGMDAFSGWWTAPLAEALVIIK